jgi:hypothetical protein
MMAMRRRLIAWGKGPATKHDVLVVALVGVMPLWFPLIGGMVELALR